MVWPNVFAKVLNEVATPIRSFETSCWEITKVDVIVIPNPTPKMAAIKKKATNGVEAGITANKKLPIAKIVKLIRKIWLSF